jgi:hypothetical protein
MSYVTVVVAPGADSVRWKFQLPQGAVDGA